MSPIGRAGEADLPVLVALPAPCDNRAERGCPDEAPVDSAGLWHQAVDKGDQADNWHDTPGSAMLICALRRAIDLGLAGEGDSGQTVRRGIAG